MSFACLPGTRGGIWEKRDSVWKKRINKHGLHERKKGGELVIGKEKSQFSWGEKGGR